MKYIKTYESTDKKETEEEKDIKYLSRGQSSQSGTEARKYVEEVIEYYKLTAEQIHNLKLAIDYNYLSRDDFGTVLNSVINLGYMSHYIGDSERKFKIAYNKNFKTKIIKIKKPYPIGYLTWNKYPLKITAAHDLNSHDFNDLIGEIPAEYPVSKKYVIGRGRYRGELNDRKSLWEQYKNTKRESEFIQVVNEKDLYILTPKDIEEIEIMQNQNKYNL